MTTLKQFIAKVVCDILELDKTSYPKNIKFNVAVMPFKEADGSWTIIVPEKENDEASKISFEIHVN